MVIAECFKSDKAPTASFLSDFINMLLNPLIRVESLKINTF